MKQFRIFIFYSLHVYNGKPAVNKRSILIKNTHIVISVNSFEN